jgi:hypothetical protein
MKIAYYHLSLMELLQSHISGFGICSIQLSCFWFLILGAFSITRLYITDDRVKSE